VKFEKGHQKLGGKKLGTLNKNTTELKEAVKALLDDNKDNFKEWINVIAEENPEKAIRLLIDLMEFVIPKLARTDLTSGDKPIQPNLNVTVDSSETAKLLKELINGAESH
jgi:hypothetical protein